MYDISASGMILVLKFSSRKKWIVSGQELMPALLPK